MTSPPDGAADLPAFAVPDGEGEIIDTARFLVRATAEDTARRLTMFEELPPLLDTSRHVHRYEDVTFHVLDGEHELVSGKLTYARASERAGLTWLD